MKFHHIGMEVTNLNEAKRFFGKMGFVVESFLVLGGEKLIFMRQGDFRIELLEAPEATEHEIHLCFEVADFDFLSHRDGAVKYENGWESFFLPGLNGMAIELLKR